MEVAKVRISGACAEAVDKKTITRGMIGAQVRMEYTDPIWEGLTKTVVFRLKTIVKDVMDAGELVTIPPEVLVISGHNLWVGIEGRNADGTLVIPTVWADLGSVRRSASPCGDPSTNPTLPVWAQLQEQIDELKQNGISDEQIAEAVTDYLKENPTDLTGYAKTEDIPTKVSQLTNDSGYLTEHQDISGKLDTNELPDAIATALAQAKASGEFDGAPGEPGKDGYTPVKGVDYFDGEDGKDYILTDEDKTEIAGIAAELVEIPESIAQSDWNAAEGEPGHVLNRTHWTESEVSEILPETVLTKDSDMGLFVLSEPLGLVDGGEYTVTWNGTEYVCKATEMTDNGDVMTCLGNFGIFDGVTGTGEPFLLMEAPADQVENLGFSALIIAEGDTATVSIIGGKMTIHKLDNKYLDLDWLPVYTDGDVVLEEQTVEVTTSRNDWYVGVASVPVIVPKTGQLLTVYINGIRYPAVVNHDNVDGTIIQAGDDQYANTMENLFLGNSTVRIPGAGYVVEFLAEVPGTYKIAIYLRDSVPMPETFLPDTIARVSDIPTDDYINSLIDAKLANW